MKTIVSKLWHDVLSIIDHDAVKTLLLLIAVAAVSLLIGYLNYPTP